MRDSSLAAGTRAVLAAEAGLAVRIEHWGMPLLLTPEARIVGAIPPAPAVEAFGQPAGRAPRRRRPARQPFEHQR